MNLSLLFLVAGVCFSISATAQVCSDPAGVIYGLTSSGKIYPINVSNATVGSRLHSAYGSPSSANALGYNGLNGKFYYFNVNYSYYSYPQFVSYDPTLNTFAVLATPPVSGTVVSGCVSADGYGYYCLDVNARLYYYDINANSWTRITTSFTDQSGNSITQMIKNLSSGDIAFDGNGNLWFVFSSSSQYGVYELSAPVPTSSVTSVSLQQVVAPSTSTPDGSIIPGIAFNANGQIFLSTSNDNLYILNSDLTTTYKGTFTISGVGVDLTSCNFPHTVLPLDLYDLTAEQETDASIILSWKPGTVRNPSYFIEHSTDGLGWEMIRNQVISKVEIRNLYSAKITDLSRGRHFFRVQQRDPQGRIFHSKSLEIVLTKGNQTGLWPNPCKDYVYIPRQAEGIAHVSITDVFGRTLVKKALLSGESRMETEVLTRGSFILQVYEEGKMYIYKLIRE